VQRLNESDIYLCNVESFVVQKFILSQPSYGLTLPYITLELVKVVLYEGFENYRPDFETCMSREGVDRHHSSM